MPAAALDWWAWVPENGVGSAETQLHSSPCAERLAPAGGSSSTHATSPPVPGRSAQAMPGGTPSPIGSACTFTYLGAPEDSCSRVTPSIEVALEAVPSSRVI